MMMMQRQQGSAPWVFAQELKESYTVREVPLTADKIDDEQSYDADNGKKPLRR